MPIPVFAEADTAAAEARFARGGRGRGVQRQRHEGRRHGRQRPVVPGCYKELTLHRFRCSRAGLHEPRLLSVVRRGRQARGNVPPWSLKLRCGSLPSARCSRTKCPSSSWTLWQGNRETPRRRRDYGDYDKDDTGEYLKVAICAYADMDADQDGFKSGVTGARPDLRASSGTTSSPTSESLRCEILARVDRLLSTTICENLRPRKQPPPPQPSGMPLVKEGRLTALMAIHEKVPRLWDGRGPGHHHRGHRTVVGTHRACQLRSRAQRERGAAPRPRTGDA